MQKLYLPIALFIIIIGAALVLVLVPGPAEAPTVSQNDTQQGATTTPQDNEGDTIAGIADLILVGSPTKGATVTSPLTVTGSARGYWYFEATFPIELRDASGKIIAQHYAEAQSEWMTEDFVIFKGTLTFPQQPAGSKGTLILHKSNASGDPERDQSVSIPVTF